MVRGVLGPGVLFGGGASGEAAFGSSPLNLSGEWPRCTDVGHDRLRIALGVACACGGDRARLTKRLVGSGYSVHLQCETCGTSTSGGLKRAEFQDWETFPEFDDQKRQDYWAARDEESRRALAQRRADALRHTSDGIEARHARRREYADWCRTAPEWAAMRQRVLQRAGFICEACLTAPAVTAHHLTYEYGKLPPAWLLKAVCEGCHRRFHADKLGREDEWCVYGRPPEAP